ncbi:sensor domain-containing diguanylate cyclase [Cohnella nanjingensis]|uniref:GGDEF domain-containing protein n=1 Tax=Cohnella nanjingensis TaxID=1387779 RepID=A0A7X0RXU1_9BACL|nr:sensor domain-containing diguanylate cyclase [Cohnella nanjingensis]MBB6675648.1 GGDEF domain-containing protein [Cohnella nanjingensis]
MGVHMVYIALHVIPCAMLGWLACEVYQRNPRHPLNRTASAMFGLMALLFSGALLDQTLPTEHVGAFVTWFELLPAIVLNGVTMLFIRQLTARVAAPSFSNLDLCLAAPPAAAALLLAYPSYFGLGSPSGGASGSGEGAYVLMLAVTAICAVYSGARWVQGWRRLRDQPQDHPPRIQLLQVGLALLFGGAWMLIVSVVVRTDAYRIADEPPAPLFALLLFGFFIRRAMLHYGFMPSLMEKYRVLFDLSPFGVLLIDSRSIVREANPMVLLLFGYTAEQMRGQSLDTFLAEGESLPQAANGSAQGEVEIVGGRGERKRVSAQVNELFAEGERLSYVVLQDITERKKAEEEIVYLAYHDPLTGLGNRLQFQEAMRALLNGPERGALLILDLDHFKEVNDVHGHLAGDEFLRHIAGIMRACVPAPGQICRIGGDEFAVLLPGAAEAGAAEAIAHDLLAGLTGEGGAVQAGSPVTVSIGISLWPTHAADPVSLIHAADVAMYQAKQQGRNRYRLYQPSASVAETSGSAG